MTSKPRDLIKRINKLGVVANRSRHPNTVVALGDSRVAQIHADGTKLNKAGFNHFSVGNALAGNRAILLKNLGNSGERTDQVLARLKTAIDTGAYVLYIHCGVNDIAQNYPTASTSGATAFSNIRTMIDAAVYAGMLPLVCLDPGANSMATAQIAQLFILNQMLREYAETCPRMVLVDIPSALWNPAATSTTALALVGTVDGTHEGNLGAYNAGKLFAAALQAIMPPRPHGVRSAVEVPGTSLINLLNNPMFTTVSGGTLSGGNTGTVAGSWTGNRTGGSSGVFSVGTAGDGSGLYEQVMACTFAAAGEEVRIQQDVNIANWSIGDILQASSEIAVDAGSSNLAGVYTYLQVNGSGNGFAAITSMDGYCVGAGAGSTEGYKLNHLTEKLVVPNYTTKSWATMHVKAIAAGAGSATVRIRRAQIRKRFT
jgi:lysophospholipase L1-like esterase